MGGLTSYPEKSDFSSRYGFLGSSHSIKSLLYLWEGSVNKASSSFSLFILFMWLVFSLATKITGIYYILEIMKYFHSRGRIALLLSYSLFCPTVVGLEQS